MHAQPTARTQPEFSRGHRRVACHQKDRLLVGVANDEGFQNGVADLLEPYGRAPEPGWFTGLLRVALPRPLVRASLAPAYGNPAAMTDDMLERYHALLLAPGNRQALLDRMAQLVLQPPEPWLARVTAPVLLVWGEQDRIIPVAHANALSGRCRVEVLPGRGHMVQMEAANDAQNTRMLDGAHTAKSRG